MDRAEIVAGALNHVVALGEYGSVRGVLRAQGIEVIEFGGNLVAGFSLYGFSREAIFINHAIKDDGSRLAVLLRELGRVVSEGHTAEEADAFAASMLKTDIISYKDRLKQIAGKYGVKLLEQYSLEERLILHNLFQSLLEKHNGKKQGAE